MTLLDIALVWWLFGIIASLIVLKYNFFDTRGEIIVSDAVWALLTSLLGFLWFIAVMLIFIPEKFEDFLDKPIIRKKENE